MKGEPFMFLYTFYGLIINDTIIQWRNRNGSMTNDSEAKWPMTIKTYMFFYDSK